MKVLLHKNDFIMVFSINVGQLFSCPTVNSLVFIVIAKHFIIKKKKKKKRLK